MLHTPNRLIALTMGDPAGIGPEVLVRAVMELRDIGPTRISETLLAIAHPEMLRRAVGSLQLSLDVKEIASLGEARQLAPNVLGCLNPCAADVLNVKIGAVSSEAGQAAFDCLTTAANLALAGEIDAITTAPLNKAALHAAGHKYPGHTEILGEICGVSNFGMMLYLPNSEMIRSPNGLGVVHTTLHTSIRSVPELLSTAAIGEKIGLMDDFMKRLGCEHPRVGVCALNPHAGEDGLFGDEEARLIRPAVEQALASNVRADGPIPADALLRRAVGGEFDGVVAMYHDQGHIALKLIGFDRAVNVTLGLPIVRTSPSHGTAFDIAGSGQASAEGMVAAVRVASQLASTTVD
jgi:4-hydroxythreonine-4-phosphate dehydrogenase